MEIAQPTEIKLLQKSRILEVTFEDGSHFELPCEYLRVFSPSAEVQGHGSEPQKPITGKKNVNIISIEPVGNYAVKLIFDDGHCTGIYSWETLFKLGKDKPQNWPSP